MSVSLALFCDECEQPMARFYADRDRGVMPDSHSLRLRAQLRGPCMVKAEGRHPLSGSGDRDLCEKCLRESQ